MTSSVLGLKNVLFFLTPFTTRYSILFNFQVGIRISGLFLFGQLCISALLLMLNSKHDVSFYTNESFGNCSNYSGCPMRIYKHVGFM